MNKKYLEWSDIENLVQNIQYKLGDFKPDVVAGIARGGAIPAVMLSHILNIPCQIFTWQTRDGGEKDARYDIIESTICEDRQNVLLVDDINDTGLTFNEIITSWKTTESMLTPGLVDKHVRTAGLIERDNSNFSVDFYGTKEESGAWIVFPFER